MRRGAAIAVATAALVVIAGPALAIENAQFGIAPASTGAQSVSVEPGGRASTTLVVWSKADAPIDLLLGVEPVTVGDDGSATLAGDDEASSWVELSTARLRLDPAERRMVHVEIDAPRRLDGEPRTVAVVAEPVASGDAAVVQRLALVVEIATSAGVAPRGSAGLPWVALALVVAVVAGHLGRRMRHRRRLV